MTHVEEDEGDEDADIPPPVRVLDAEGVGQELVRGAEGAVCTGLGGARVGEVPADDTDEGVQIRRAALPCRRHKLDELYRGTVNLGVADD